MGSRELDILVVEDDEVFQEALQRRLRTIDRFESNVTVCESIEGAREALRENAYDVGLFDYSLPDGVSLELVQYLASDLQNPIALIIVTALDDEETRSEIIAAGAQDYLVKGDYDDSLLERSILLALERRRGAHLRRRLEKTTRLVELGSLAADVAHHFNNPVAILSNNIQFSRGIADQLERAVVDGDIDPQEIEDVVAELRDISEESSEAMARLTRLISDVQLLGGPDPDALEPCDVNELVREVVDEADFDDVDVSYSLVEVPVISVERGRIRRAFSHALQNAVEAAQRASGDAEVEVETRHREQGVLITFADSGPGIAADMQEDVFRPFFTTKPPSRGRGLGLPVLQNVVRAHGGKVGMESTPSGTELSIWLPTDAGGLGDTPVETLYRDTDVDAVASKGSEASESSSED